MKSEKLFDRRKYKIRGAKTVFFCPLCGTERALRYSSKLSRANYIQIFLTSIVIMLATFTWMGEKSFFWPFIIWAGFEFVNKLLFRKEIPCPHCGFDATWYKRNVMVARKLCNEFWQAKGLQTGYVKKAQENTVGVDSELVTKVNLSNPDKQGPSLGL